MEIRDFFVWYALQWLKTPYHYGTFHGGDDPMGMDCSGFVSECLQAVGYARNRDRRSADGWLKYFKRRDFAEKASATAEGSTPPSLEVSELGPGVLQFFLDEKNRAFHVNIGLNDRFVIGAIGGESATVTDLEAAQRNAFVKIRPADYYPVGTIVLIDPFVLPPLRT